MNRRRSIVRVPQLHGLTVRAAEDALLDAGLLPLQVGQGPGAERTDRDGATVVRGQDPRPGVRMVPGGRVRFWCASPGDDPPRGGGGTHLPRGPRPLSPAGRKPF
jgi:beta-lactam-binding protein with PASTA domain